MSAMIYQLNHKYELIGRDSERKIVLLRDITPGRPDTVYEVYEEVFERDYEKVEKE